MATATESKTTHANNLYRKGKPAKTESHRIPRECFDSVKRYLYAYHDRSWWKIDDFDHDKACVQFTGAKNLADIVYAFVEGWKARP